MWNLAYIIGNACKYLIVQDRFHSSVSKPKFHDGFQQAICRIITIGDFYYWWLIISSDFMWLIGVSFYSNLAVLAISMITKIFDFWKKRSHFSNSCYRNDFQSLRKTYDQTLQEDRKNFPCMNAWYKHSSKNFESTSNQVYWKLTCINRVPTF